MKIIRALLTISTIIFLQYADSKITPHSKPVADSYVEVESDYINRKIMAGLEASMRLYDIKKFISKFSSKSDEIFNAIQKYSRKYDIDMELIIAIIWQESTFRSNVCSYANAKGLMQVRATTKTGKDVWLESLQRKNILSHEDELYNIDTNIDAGCYVLNWYISRCDGLEHSLKWYSGGSSKYARQVMKRVDRVMEL